MKIGNLKKRVTIQQCVSTPDGGGGFDTVWQDVAGTFAHIEAVSAGYDRQFERRPHVTTYRLTIPYRADVDSNMRIFDGIRVYKMTAMRDPDMTQRWLEITAAAEDP